MRRKLERVLADRSPELITDPTLENSAVVLCLQAREGKHSEKGLDAYHIPFIRRTAYREEHADEMGLPGGRADPDDAFPRETAVREVNEEIGVSPTSLDILGRLDDETTPTGYRIVPFVGHLASDAQFDPCEEEVKELLVVPLTRLREQYRGREADDPRFEYEGAVIWGATGRIVATFLDVLEQSTVTGTDGQ